MSEPKGNLIYLVCTACNQKNESDFGVKIAVRSQRGWFEQMAPTKQFNNWLEKHRNCAGRGQPDHFQLAYGFVQNHDQKALEAAVQLAVVS